MTRFVARELTTAHWFDIAAARRDLGYEPKVSIEEGLKRLAASRMSSYIAEVRYSSSIPHCGTINGDANDGSVLLTAKIESLEDLYRVQQGIFQPIRRAEWK